MCPLNLIMNSAPLAILGCGFNQSNVADDVMTQVAAKVIPYFFTDQLILRFSVKPMTVARLILLLLAAPSGLRGTGLVNLFATLIFLGIGWNFSFIGTTNLLANNLTAS